jgi:hypothetical protein
MFQRLDPPDPQIWRVKVSGCSCFLGDDLSHRAMFPECPAFSSWDVSGGHRRFDPPPSAMRREANHGIPNPGAGAAGIDIR